MPRNLRTIQTDHRWQAKRVSNHVIVHIPHVIDERQFNQILTKHGATVQEHLHQIARRVIQVDNLKLMDLIKDLHDNRMIEDAEPNSLGGGSAFTPNDPSTNQQWYLTDLHVPDAWSISTGNTNITLAVVDSGCYHHEDLTNIGPGWNYTLGSNVTNDTGALGGHGTAVTGCAAAVANNGIGIAGTAYNCTVMPLIVLTASDYAAWSNVANATMYAADHGARVINISICGTSDSSTLDAAMAYAWNKGCVIFAAAGNNANSALVYPAACPHVVAVAATDQSGNLANFSSFGPWVTFAAPGTPIYTTTGTGYGAWWGTSFSSPICAGIAVLMIAAHPTITNTQVVSMMTSTVDPIAGQPFGKVNAGKALALVQSTFAPTPPPPPPPPVLSIVATTGSATDSATAAVPFTFTVSRTGSLTSPSSVQYSVSGTAADFVGGVLPSGLISFSAGQAQATFVVNVAPNTVMVAQIFTVTLSNPVAATIGTASATSTVFPVPLPPPVISIMATTTSATDSATVSVPYTFTISRTGDLTVASSVGYTTVAQNPVIFVGGLPPSGSIPFAIGQSQATLVINVAPNTVTATQSFSVSLRNATGATIGIASSTAVVLPVPLPPPVLSIVAMTTSAQENTVVPTLFTFAVNRSGDLTNASSVSYAVSGTNASVFSGNVLPTGSVILAPGQAQVTFNVSVIPNAVSISQTFAVTLASPINATLGSSVANATIVASVPPTVAIISPPQGTVVSGPFTMTLQVTPNVSGTHKITVTDECAGWNGNASITYNA